MKGCTFMSLKYNSVCLFAFLVAVYSFTGGTAAIADISAKYNQKLLKSERGMHVQQFDLKDIRLLSGPFQHAMDIDKAYLLSLQPDRMLSWFRKEAGLTPKGEVYGGWESAGVAGCIPGHYLSAASQMYQATGDQKLLHNVNYMVEQMAECQKANGNGYLAAIPNGKTIFKEISEGHIDIKDGLNGGWVPWYTMHKVMAGLRDAYLYCSNQTAKEVLIHLADWVEDDTKNLTDEQMQKMLEVEQGGMDEVLADVYAITGNPKYLKLSERFCHQRLLEPFSEGKDVLTGLHANTQIPKFIGFQRIYQLSGDKKYNQAAENFWNDVVHNRSWVTGANSMYEAFFAPAAFPAEVTQPGGPETCNTYNMLKLTRELFQDNPDASYMDYYERALYNHILSSEDPVNIGGFVYYTSMRPGHYRMYSTPYDSMWCCVGTGMENHSKYGKNIYFHTDNSLYVNLFIPSVLNWTAKGMKVTQETKFPDEPRTALLIHTQKPQKLTFMVRYPWWVAKGAFKIRINGKSFPVNQGPSSYVQIDRIWKDGDKIDVSLPMRMTYSMLPYSKEYAAILYGPIVLAGEIGMEGLTPGYKTFHNPDQTAHNVLPLDNVPCLVADTPEEIIHKLQPVKGQSLTFRTVGLAEPHEVTLIPFYRLHFQRYAIYWQVLTPAVYSERGDRIKAEKEKAELLAKRIVDQVAIGDTTSETSHSLKGSQTGAGVLGDKNWRHAFGGGWFSYDMKSLPDQPESLLCTYWGDDSGNRTFDILIDGQKIAQETLDGSHPGKYFDVEYPIPQTLTSGKSNITVTFQAHPDNFAGGVFGCALLK
jgi:DUF1680 family protein